MIKKGCENKPALLILLYLIQNQASAMIIQSSDLELGGIPVHTEYRCLFFLRYEFLKYRNTGVI